MNARFILMLVATLVASQLFGQTAGSRPPIGGKSPQEPVPGLILRVYLGPITRAIKDKPTHLLAIVHRGHDWWDKYKRIAANELRGLTKTSETHFVASGFILLENDGEVVFDVPDGMCFVGGKDFGRGPVFRHNLKKGKHSIEFHVAYGHGLPKFEVTGAGGEKVLFHTGETLTRELNRYVKIEGRSYKSKLMDEGVEAGRPAAHASPAPSQPSSGVGVPASVPPREPAQAAATPGTATTLPRPDPFATRIPAPSRVPKPVTAPSTAPLEQRLIGTKWSFPMSDKPEEIQWVGFAADGKLLVGWNPGADRPWKMVNADTAEIRPMGYQRAVYRIQFEPDLAGARLVSGDRGKVAVKRKE